MRIFLLHLILLYSITVHAQNVGIGTVNPLARLHVVDSAVVFTGPTEVLTVTDFAPPISGAGTRMMWYPQKGAFRAGSVFGTEWDKDNIGPGSFAAGIGTKASGQLSFAMGYGSVASGNLSVVFGQLSTASGFYSICSGNMSVASGNNAVAMGDHALASGYNSFSMGTNSTANKDYATSIGYYTVASGVGATSFGSGTNASGQVATSLGSGTVASGNYATSMGWGTKAKSQSSLVIGQFNDTTDVDRLFEIGNGTANNLRQNVMTVLANGNSGFGTVSPSLTSGYIGVHILNNGYTQLRLQSSSSSAGLELDPGGTGHQYEIQANVGSDFFVYDRAVNAFRFLISGTGNVGIGNTNPSQALTVTGNILASGTITPSDFRLKRNIRPLTGALDKLITLNGVYYEYRKEEHPDLPLAANTQIGVIAQEVEAVLPEAVITDPSGYKMVDYSKLVPVLIEGMKAQQDKIRQQDEKMAQLLKRIEALEQQKER